MGRPALTDQSFYAFLFRPSKNPKPVGLRHRILKGTTGQRKARINAYNKMPAEKQAVIDRAGHRDSYLKGASTFTEAKRTLREKAVRLGVVKPVAVRRPVIGPKQQIYDDAVIQHYHDEGLNTPRENAFRQRLAVTRRHTKREMLAATKAEIRRNAARRASDFDDEYDFNPWWYN